MRGHDDLHTEEASNAAREAGKGAVIGGAKWGCVAAVLGGIGYAYWPVYRGTTIQFKIYLQMSGMVFGGMIDADRRLREYEQKMRIQRRLMRERTKWQRYEEEISRGNGK